jgi:outer membrane protease
MPYGLTNKGGIMQSRRCTVLIFSVVSLLGCSLMGQAEKGPDVQVVDKDRLISVAMWGGYGWLHGESKELVYEPGRSGGRYKLSELDWDLKDIQMGGVGGTLTLAERVHLNVSYWSAVTKGNGEMDDYDWLLEEEGSPWTDWSLSDVDVTRGYIFDAHVSADLLKFKKASLGLAAGYRETRWKWTDYGRYHIYSSYPYEPWGFRDDIAEEDGSNGIKYQQLFQIPYAGVTLKGSVKQLQLAAYFSYSPFVKAEDEDWHLFRGIYFKETFEDGDFYGVGARATYLFKTGIFLGVAVDHQEVPEIIGDAEATDEEGHYEEWSDGAGISTKSTMYSIHAGYAF